MFLVYKMSLPWMCQAGKVDDHVFVLGVSILPLLTILIFHFENVQIVIGFS